jgi:hypothetical protein
VLVVVGVLFTAGVMEYRNVIERQELAGVVGFAIVGLVLVALAPAKQSVGKASAEVASKSSGMDLC